MNSALPSTSNVSIPSVKKLQIFKKCQCLVSRYVLALQRIQEKIFEDYGETEEQRQFFDGGFYNTNNLSTHHKPFCAAFAKCHERCETPRIEDMMDDWQLLIKTLKTPQYHYISNESQSMGACQNLMKFIIGFCFLEYKYYEALHCLWILLRFTRYEDTNCWLLCLLWALRLEEWELLGYFIKQERKTLRKWPVSEGYIACVESIQISHRLAVAKDEREQSEAVDELIAKLKFMLNNAKQTYLYSQAKSVLRRSLIISSRLPNADFGKIDDPFYQRELELSSCMNVVRSYHPNFFLSSKSSSIQPIIKSGDEFMRFCSAYADYMETAMTYCWDFWDSGMVREAEGTCFSLWRYNMAFGNAHWTLRFLSLLFHIKSNTTFEIHLLDLYANCLQTLLTPRTASTSYYLNYLSTPKRNIRPSVFRRGSAVDDSFDFDLHGFGESNTNRIRNNLDEMLAMEMSSINLLHDSDEQKEYFHLEMHVSNCECSFCAWKTSNWAMELELEWLKLLFRRFSSQQFELFQKKLNELDTEKIQSFRQKLFMEMIESERQKTVNKNTPGKMRIKTPNEVEKGRNASINAKPILPKRRGRPPKNRQIETLETPGKENNEQLTRNLTGRIEQKTPTIQFTQIVEQNKATEGELCRTKRLPPIFVHYSARSICSIFLEKSSEISKSSYSHLKRTIELCEQFSTPLFQRANWLLLRLLRQSKLLQIQAAVDDFKNYGHLFFREWRLRCCSFLARNLLNYNQNQWLSAFYQIESMVPSIRQAARLNLRKKGTLIQQVSEAIDNIPFESFISNQNHSPTTTLIPENNANINSSAHLSFKNLNQLKRSIDRLPLDMTYVNILMDENYVLWLTRCHAFYEPIAIKLCQIEKNDEMLKRLQFIMESNDESVKKSMRPLDDDFDYDHELMSEEEREEREKKVQQKRAKIFWEERKQLDKDMKQFCSDLQSKWFASAAPLLLPNTQGSTAATRIVNKLTEDGIFSKSTAMTLMYLIDRLDEDECSNLAQLLQQNEIILQQNGGQQQQKTQSRKSLWIGLKKLTEKGRYERIAEKRFTLLAVPPALSQLPWESLPIFKRSPYVLRIPSLHIFEHLFYYHQTIPRKVDGQNSFYLLNPSGDLMNTQNRMEEFINQFEWRGLTGKAPSRDQIRHALTQYDLFLYIGHGSGGRYVGRTMMRDNDCRAVSILMGCSSVRIMDEGVGFDGRATLYDLLIARCPCIIGCLWLVTDGEIDRFFLALMEYCFTMKKDDNDKQNSKLTKAITTRDETASTSLKLIAEGMALARSHCKLPYLTGASVVSYGLPVVSLMNLIL